MREIRTEVLVVGAGPVGLCTALLLAEAGLETVIIDREQRTAARSYACALHPASLELLDRLGVTPALLDLGRRIPKVGFYEGTARRAELDFSRCGEAGFRFCCCCRKANWKARWSSGCVKPARG
jgi:2-polyprenyl-6-methoxyphenol hydroxylase-like FAD-dependent oxidoreductase